MSTDDAPGYEDLAIEYQHQMTLLLAHALKSNGVDLKAARSILDDFVWDHAMLLDQGTVQAEEIEGEPRLCFAVGERMLPPDGVALHEYASGGLDGAFDDELAEAGYDTAAD